MWFILALLAQQGIITPELAEALGELSEKVVVMDYAGAQQAVGDMIDSMPCWDSCMTCRSQLLSFKVQLVNFHAAGHKQVEQITQ